MERQIKITSLGECYEGSEYEWYGRINLEIDGSPHHVACAIGVSPYLRATMHAAGDGPEEYLTAEWLHPGDWESLPGDDDSQRQLAEEVIATIHAERKRIWRETQANK